jgi:CAAX protease family protein
MFLAFLVSAAGEELGWSGYATGPIQARWGELGAGLLLGVVWAAWHLVPLIQVDRPLGWIAGWSLGTVANRIIIVRLYNATGGSVFGATLYHAMNNLSWQLFPNRGSHYDPRISGPLLGLAAAVVVVCQRSGCELGSTEPAPHGAPSGDYLRPRP